MLERPDGFWVRDTHPDHDGDLVNEVYYGDTYRTSLVPVASEGDPELVIDIGASIGVFPRRWREKNPDAVYVCVDANADNLPMLERNLQGMRALVLHGACTYEPGELALLNSVQVAGITETTGGSIVAPVAVVEASRDRRYWRDLRPLPKFTLEELVDCAVAEFGLKSRIVHLLKLDCEGSEFSILANARLERIRFIVGEYHGHRRWQELVRLRFPDSDWSYGHMSDGELGVFHLRNDRYLREMGLDGG